MLSGWQKISAADRARVQQGIVQGRVLGGPWHLEVQPTNLCNVDCFFCISKPGRHGESLDWPFFRDFLIHNRQRDLRFLRLTGGGDPLVYPHIRPLIETCDEHGIQLENITTNGTRLAPLANRLIEVGTDCVLISLNESDPQRYAKTMKAAPQDFHRALEGVKAMIAARNSAPSGRRPKVWLQLFIWKESFEHITQMYELARGLDVDTIFFRTIFGKMGQVKMCESDRPCIEAQLHEIIADDSKSGRYRLHFDVDQELDLHLTTYAEQDKCYPQGAENFSRFAPAHPRTEYCYVGWYTTSINARGDVYPCFQYHEMEDKIVGNIYQSSLDEIWRGERYELFRNQFRELAGLNGRMEPSRRYNRFIERKCVDCSHCQYTFRLMDPEFYAEVTPQLRRAIPLTQKLRSFSRNVAIYGAHRVMRRPK